MKRLLVLLAPLLALCGALAPAHAASVVLCRPDRFESGAGGGSVNLPNLSKSYTPDAHGCVDAVGLGDIAVFRTNGWVEIGPTRSIILNTGLATGTTSYVLGTLPPNAYIREIFASNSTANATAGIGIGTTSGGTDVVASITCAANCLTFTGDVALLKRVFSLTAPQVLYASGLSTGWNSANVTITVVYGFM
jgi:hypothetical protein